jgi:hypothetical protein
MHCGCFCCHQRLSPWESWREAPERARMSSRNKKHSDNISPDKGRCISLCRDSMETGLPSPSPSVTLPGLRLPASASLPLASCWPRPQQLLPVSATGGGRRRCSQRERLWQAASFPVSFWRKEWYNGFAVHPAYLTGEEVDALAYFLTFLVSVGADVVSHFICKWLDRYEENRKA